MFIFSKLFEQLFYDIFELVLLIAFPEEIFALRPFSDYEVTKFQERHVISVMIGSIFVLKQMDRDDLGCVEQVTLLDFVFSPTLVKERLVVMSQAIAFDVVGFRCPQRRRESDILLGFDLLLGHLHGRVEARLEGVRAIGVHHEVSACDGVDHLAEVKKVADIGDSKARQLLTVVVGGVSPVVEYHKVWGHISEKSFFALF